MLTSQQDTFVEEAGTDKLRTNYKFEAPTTNNNSTAVVKIT